MQPAIPSSEQIRHRFLSEHQSLRGKSAVVEALALGVLRGDGELASALRLKGEELQRHLLLHMQWEEAQLLPLIQRVARPGESMGEALVREHRRQRQRLANSLVALRAAPESAETLARHVLKLIRWIETDMRAEEKEVLDAIERETGAGPRMG